MTKASNPKGGRPAIGPAFSLRLPVDMLARIDTDAARQGISRAAWIRRTCAAQVIPARMVVLTDTTTGETAVVPHDHDAIAATLSEWFPGVELASEVETFAAELLRHRPARNAPGQVSTPVAGADIGLPLGIEWTWASVSR